MDNKEYTGIWWLPEEPDKKISGILIIHQYERAHLELQGSVGDIPECFNVEGINRDIILGITKDGKDITLYKCYQKSFNFGGGFITSSFLVNAVFIGHHFEKKEDIVFNSISLKYSHINNWYGKSGFKTNLNEFNKNGELKISYKNPQKIKIVLDYFSISIVCNLNINANIPIKELNLKQVTLIKIEQKYPIHIDQFIKYKILNIESFLQFGVGATSFIDSAEGNNSIKSLNNIEIYYPVKKGAENIEVLPNKMVFIYDDISDDFDEILKNWFKKSDVLKPVFDLYFSVFDDQNMYTEQKFLSLSQALEAYHRRIFGGKYLPDHEYEGIKEILIAAIPEQQVKMDFRTSLTNRIKFGNEFSLRKRLKEIFINIEQYNINITPGYNNSTFINNLVENRNKLTHYAKNTGFRTENLIQLYEFNKVMKSILEISFLIEIGISSEKIKQIIKKHNDLKNVFLST